MTGLGSLGQISAAQSPTVRTTSTLSRVPMSDYRPPCGGKSRGREGGSPGRLSAPPAPVSIFHS
jgi:hypothetical protein